MRQHHYANTTAQQQPRRPMDRQQQQSSGSGDYQPQASTNFGASGVHGASRSANAGRIAPALRQVFPIQQAG